MGKSNQPSLADIRRAFRLVGEAAELGSDPMAWRRHLAVGLCELVAARAAFHGEEHVATKQADSQVRGYVVLGIEGRSAAAGLEAYMANGGFNIHPFFPYVYPRATQPWTRMRREIVADDRAYYGSIVVSQYKRACDIDDTIHSRQPIPRKGWANMIAVFRGLDEKPFAVRQRRLVHLVHQETARLWWRPDTPDPAADLPPRMRQIVEGFRAGEVEKQVAFRLGLAPATLHDYVKQLYRRVGVSNRFDLLSKLAPPARGLRLRLNDDA